MYNDIGNKIKLLAKCTFICEAIASITAAIIVFSGAYVEFGFVPLICGPLIAWSSSLVLYGFGQLVEDVHAIRYKKEIKDHTKTSPEIESTPSIKKPSPTHKAKLYMEMGFAPEKLGNGYICPVCKMIMDSMRPCERCHYVPPMKD